MKKQNSIDLIVENLIENISKIKDFDLAQNDPNGKKLLNFIVKVISEFNSYQNLFIQYYIPASRKSIIDTKREIKHSKYKSYFEIAEDDYLENYYETIRLGYVGAYHKYENFIKNLLELLNDFFSELDFNGELNSIEGFLKKDFNVDIYKSSNIFYITRKINWISNCVKHYDGFPIKEPIPYHLKYFDKNKRIQIESKEFKNDITELIKHNQSMLNIFFLVGFYQVFNFDYSLIKDQIKPEYQNEEKIELFKFRVRTLIGKLFEE